MSATKQLTVLVSGNGSNLQAIIKAISAGGLNAQINTVITNRSDAYAVTRAHEASLPTLLYEWDRTKESRDEYEINLARRILILLPKTDVIVLAGWMHVLGAPFLDQFRNTPIINLHPALPGQFPGNKSIQEAWEAFQRGEISHTGVMCHHVIEEVDAGAVLSQAKIPIYPSDTVETLKTRIQFHEKGVLLQGIQSVLIDGERESGDDDQQVEIPPEPTYPKFIRSGKVRDIWDLGYGLLAMVHSNRISGFDRNLGDITGKGSLLTAMSAWWFNKTRKIMNNHYLYHQHNVMIVKKYQVLPVEVVLRAYITGSTATSLWTHYARGEREYCGLQFPDGLVKNQKLESVVITPTTKDDVHDEPISAEEVVSRGLMTQFQWNEVSKRALELFEYAAKKANKAGLILVDTKLEFGVDRFGNVAVIDEMFTCDSSRFWQLDSYETCMANGEAPKSLDKDLVRRWIKSNCDDPYQAETLPEVPKEVRDGVFNAYRGFYQQLTRRELSPPEILGRIKDIPTFASNYFAKFHSKTVIVLSGSERDQPHVEKIQTALDLYEIPSVWHVLSAHKQTREVLDFLEDCEDQIENGRQLIFCCVAGRSNALGAVTACNSSAPVISCPPFSSKDDYLVNVHSSLQNPSKVPVAVVLDPGNLALFCRKIFSLRSRKRAFNDI